VWPWPLRIFKPLYLYEVTGWVPKECVVNIEFGIECRRLFECDASFFEEATAGIHILGYQSDDNVTGRWVFLLTESDETILAHPINFAGALIQHQLQPNFILPKAGGAV
tara:strand:- start:420 stop:746 length:327 start_codon:yes stop_codon:yes gene_type:complete